MTKSFFIGVDGGATKCIVRVEDSMGHLLGREVSGPASIRISVQQAFESIQSALKKILARLNISLQDSGWHFHAGMGLAGCEVASAQQAFLALPHDFDTLVISSDAHTACLGAHAGKDGSIIIIGTGVVGFQIRAHQTLKVGGWGFPQDDEGGGAFLGLQAVRVTLQALDGRLPHSMLSKRVFARFDENMERFSEWMNQANSTAFAELAPLVIEQYKADDPVAIEIMRQSALAIDRIFAALHAVPRDQTSVLPCSLIGGIAPFIEPLLSASLQARLSPCQMTPDAGAVFLVRDFLAKDDQ